MKRILCVIDLTQSAEKVLEVAAMISNSCHAHLIVLYPYRLIHNGHSGDMPSLKVKLEKEAREKFCQLLQNLSGRERFTCEFHPEIGFIADRINAHVKKDSVDMVIVGQEHTSTTNDIKGFNIQNLIAGSKLPFVIVPSEAKVNSLAVM